MSKLTPRQACFVEEYLLDLNATQAAIRAGYSAKTAANIGHENLRKPEIAAAIQRARTRRAARVEVSQDYVLGRLIENVERSMQAEPVRDREGNETGEYVYAGAVANKALELLGKHVGIFVERVEHSGEIVVSVTRKVLGAPNRVAAYSNGAKSNGNGSNGSNGQR